jgi:hypothetical protein
MHYAQTTIYVCMLLDGAGEPIKAEVIEASTDAAAEERAAEVVQCTSPSKPAHGYELWHRGRRLCVFTGHASRA